MTHIVVLKHGMAFVYLSSGMEKTDYTFIEHDIGCIIDDNIV